VTSLRISIIKNCPQNFRHELPRTGKSFGHKMFRENKNKIANLNVMETAVTVGASGSGLSISANGVFSSGDAVLDAVQNVIGRRDSRTSGVKRDRTRFETVCEKKGRKGRCGMRR
jgi:hypothetical protein